MHRNTPRIVGERSFSTDLLSLVYMPSGGRWPRICACTSA